jgi:hypothetical protein
MKKTALFAVAVLLVAGLALVGCQRQSNDEQSIENLLSGSGYTNDEHAKNYGANDTTLERPDSLPGFDGYEKPPFVRFRRYIPPGGVSRSVNIQIPAYPGGPDTTALATITWQVTGELRTMFDTTTNPIYVWRKPFTDKGTRRIYLEKYDDRWHIRKVSPLAVATENPAYNLNITSIHAVSALSHDTFDLTTTDTLLAKDQLPWFLPGDTVTVTITVASDGDSCWIFLHHGRPQKPHIWRKPYWRTSTWTFERTWYVGDETYEGPAVRPSAHDAIGWGTLWSDTTKPYVAAAWGIPYIVKMPEDPLPADE